MKYDFETTPKRFGICAPKWDEVEKYFPDRPDDVIPFSVADMEFPIAPEIREGLKAYIDQYPLGYTNRTESYLEAICDWMKRRHQWNIKPEWILPSAGVIKAFFTCIRAYTQPGDGVMLMTPIYYPMYAAIENNHRKLVRTSLLNHDGRYEIDWEDFEKKAKAPQTKLLILCSPHNPSSRVWTRDELERIGRICIDNNVLICSDEIHFDLIMPGHHHTVFASISEEFAQHCVICTAPSKTFNLAGLQTSTIIIPNPQLRQEFLNVGFTECVNPKCCSLGYVANELAYRKGEAWFDACLQVIEKNRETVTRFVQEEIPQIKLTPMEGTYLQWMDLRALQLEPEKQAEILRKEGKLFFDDGYVFGEEGKGFERWNLACPTHYVEQGLERLKKVVTAYSK